MKEAPKNPRRSQRSTEGDIWTHPSEDFDAQFAAERLKEFPVDAWMSVPERRKSFLEFLEAAVSWTAERLHPSWADPNDDGQRSVDLYEWIGSLSSVVAKAAAYLPADELYRRFVDPIGSHDRREDIRYLAGVVDCITRRHVFDAPEPPPQILDLLGLALERLLQERSFQPNSYHAGEVSTQPVADIVNSLLLVSATDCPASTRFANDDWSDLSRFLPLIEQLMSAAGWGDGVMSRFLRLCRRAGSAIPIDVFVRLINASMDAPGFRPERWNGQSIPAEISGAIQTLADSNYPLTRPQARALLTILDRLVDMGDRRAAALQQSEHFRSVQLLPSG